MEKKNKEMPIVAIKVENVSKKFKLFYDKHYTLKERLVFWKNKKSETHQVLNDINLEIFKQALNNTLTKRDAFDYYKDYRQILNGLTNDERINNYWRTYKKKTKYAQNIEFKQIIKALEEFLNNI